MNNEEKILTLLETMNNRIGSIEDNVETMNSRMGNMEDNMGTMNNRMGNIEDTVVVLEKGQDILARQVSKLTEDVQEIRQSQVRMENELTEKVSALFDAREVQNDVNERIVTALDRIEAKVDVLQLETAHLRRVK
ncbi:MAG: hypothetical protein GX133_10475 [Syntrophomonadaceae bacterium]|nr:hypothetical protein [Syntrophomonadaceae bacterium]